MPTLSRLKLKRVGGKVAVASRVTWQQASDTPHRGKIHGEAGGGRRGRRAQERKVVESQEHYDSVFTQGAVLRLGFYRGAQQWPMAI